MLKYHYQMDIILKHIFSATEKRARKDPNNWMRRMTNLVGGIDFQHAHADQAWPWELEGELTFPFVGFLRARTPRQNLLQKTVCAGTLSLTA